MAQTELLAEGSRERATSKIRRNGIRIQIFATFFVLWIATWAVVFFSLYLAKKEFRETYHAQLNQRLDVVENILTTTAGENALQNATTANRPTFSPYVLNVSAIDVENPRKAVDIVAQSACVVAFDSQAELCAAIGNLATVGAYLYIVGRLDGLDVIEHLPGTPIEAAHHIDLHTSIQGHDHHWLVVFQASPKGSRGNVAAFKSDLYATGYGVNSDGRLEDGGRDEKEIRGRLTYLPSSSDCRTPPCATQLQFAFRVPIEEFRGDTIVPDGLWPPKDFKDLRVRLKLISPAVNGRQSAVLIDTESSNAKRKYSLDAEIGPRFDPLERPAIYKAMDSGSLLWAGTPAGQSAISPISPLSRLALLMVPGKFEPDGQGHRRTIKGKLGSYILVVKPSEALADTFVGPLAAQLLPALAGTWIVIFSAWVFVEVRIVKRVRRLTDRADALRSKLKNEGDQVPSTFGELQSYDELGILAQAIHKLLLRVNDDVRDKRARLDGLRSLWVAIGHDIMSPLQSLSSLHPEDRTDDKSRPYILQMESVIRTMSSAASLEQANWEVSLEALDANEYLRQLCENSALAKLPDLDFQSSGRPVFVKADPMLLDMAMRHVLDNSKRYAPAFSTVKLSLELEPGNMALICIANDGPHIPEDIISRIFDMGVSERREAKDLFTLHMGRGLYIARQIMTGMGGNISAMNRQPKGVTFLIRLARMEPSGN